MNILAYVQLRNIHGSTGAGRVARNIVEQLIAQRRDEIRILGDADDHHRIIPQVGAPWNDYTYHLFDADTSKQQRNWFLFDRPEAEAYWSDADLVYCAGESYVPTKKCRSVVLMHDAAFFDDGALSRNAQFYVQQAKWRWLFRKLSAKVDLFHTVSQFSADRLSSHFPSLRDRMRVVHNGVTDNFFATECTDDTEILRTRGLAGRQYVLLPRGLSYRKNGDLVVAAWSRIRESFKDAVLVVTSHNDPAYVTMARNLDQDVMMTGFVSDEELRALYRGARVVWFPSRYEGFGIPVLEAMACGTPVVASASSSLPEVAGDAALLVPTLDTEKHVEAIEYFLKDDRVCADYSARGRHRAADFTWRNSAHRLREVFGELA